MTNQLTILGAGAWGTALASVLSKKFEKTVIWSYLPTDADSINKQGVSSFLPGVTLKNVTATTSVKEAVKGSSIILSTVPSFSIRDVWQQIKSELSEEYYFINASKGLEKNTHLLPYQIFKEIFKDDSSYFSLCGPSFAMDAAQNKPTSVDLAGKNEQKTKNLIEALETDSFFLQLSSDIVGTELSAVLKNVVAIASGMVLGMNYGPNTQAMVIVEGIKEMMELGKAMGAQEKTFFGLAGLGDLLLTAMNQQSRNMSFGLKIGQGMTVEKSLEELKGVSEGFYTIQSLQSLITKYNVNVPLFEMLVNIFVNKKNPHEEVKKIFSKLF